MKKQTNEKEWQKKQKFYCNVEDVICDRKPELRGKFTTLMIWFDIEYHYTKGLSVMESANKILSKLA